MIKGDEKRFAVAMKVTADLYGKEPLTIEALRVFFSLLHKYSIEQVERALQKHMTASPFIPKPSDVISCIEGTLTDRGASAWVIVVEAIRHIGRYNSVAFPTPAYHYAIKQMGGWIGVCQSLKDDEITWRGKNFERFFAIGDQCATWGDEQDKIHVERYCVGLSEVHNRRNGYALPDVIDAETRLPIAGGRNVLHKFNRQATEAIQAVVKEKMFK